MRGHSGNSVHLKELPLTRGVENDIDPAPHFSSNGLKGSQCDFCECGLVRVGEI